MCGEAAAVSKRPSSIKDSRSTHPDPRVPVSQPGKGTGHLGIAAGSLEESESENPILCRVAALSRTIILVAGVLQSDIRRYGDAPFLVGRNNRLAQALNLRVVGGRVVSLVHPGAVLVAVVNILAQFLSQFDDFWELFADIGKQDAIGPAYSTRCAHFSPWFCVWVDGLTPPSLNRVGDVPASLVALDQWRWAGIGPTRRCRTRPGDSTLHSARDA